MMTVQLDGALMTTREELHDYLAEQLRLPEHYGRNLDALFDLLTEISEPVTISLINSDALGNYGAQVLSVLHDAAAENGCLTISIT